MIGPTVANEKARKKGLAFANPLKFGEPCRDRTGNLLIKSLNLSISHPVINYKINIDNQDTYRYITS